jgi:hypothetical protein
MTETIKLSAEAAVGSPAFTTTMPVQRAQPPRTPVVERLRFGPGVPAASAIAAVAGTGSGAPPRRRKAVVLSTAFTLAVVAFVVWFLWPEGPLRVRSVIVAQPATVSCGGRADVSAIVSTNGNPGTLRYPWERGDGQRSGTLRQSLPSGQRSTSLHLLWRFTGTGTYAATATVRLLAPTPASATAHFSYRCSAGPAG